MFRWICKHAWRRGRPLATLALLAIAAWFGLRWGIGGVLGQAARSVGAPAYEALAIVDPERVDLLVANALDADPRVAKPAQSAVDGLVDRWIVWARTDGASDDVRERLLGLQHEVASRLDRLTPSAAAWVQHLGDHCLRAAGALAIADRMAVVDGTSRLIERLAQTTTRLPASTIDVAELAPKSAAAVPAEPSENVAIAEERFWVIPEQLRASGSPANVARAEAPPRIVKPAPPQWRPEWQTGPTAANEPQSLPEPTIADATPLDHPTERPVDQLDDRELIAELISAGNTDPGGPRAYGPTATPEAEASLWRDAVVAELRERGFRSLRADHARLFISPSADDRRVLAERLLSEGGDTGVRLALGLARDTEPTVRVAAIRTLAASPYPQVVREAFTIAVRDPNPSVAALSESLQQRLR